MTYSNYMFPLLDGSVKSILQVFVMWNIYWGEKEEEKKGSKYCEASISVKCMIVSISLIKFCFMNKSISLNAPDDKTASALCVITCL